MISQNFNSWLDYMHAIQGSGVMMHPIEGEEVTPVDPEPEPKPEPDPDPEPEQYCVIKYTTNDDNTITLDESLFGDNFVSNEYTEKGGEIKLLATTTEIPSKAFQNQTTLVSLIIPDNITAIRDNAFEGTSALTDIQFSKNLDTIGNYAFSKSAISGEIIIPETVTSMGTNIFDSASKITSLVFNNKFNNLPSHTCINCGAMTSISLPEGIISIGQYGLAYCGKLKSLVIPTTSYFNFNSNAFKNTSLTSLTLNSATVASLAGGNDFSGTQIYVPASLVEGYKSSAYWTSYVDKIQAISE